MAGWPIAQAQRPDGMVFTLYHGAEHPFIHALSSVDAWALCIDLPATGADDPAAAADWGLTATADGTSIVAANATLGVAVEIPLSDLAVRRSGTFAPSASTGVSLAKFGHQAGGVVGRRIVASPLGSVIYAAGPGGIVALDTSDLSVDGQVPRGGRGGRHGRDTGRRRDLRVASRRRTDRSARCRDRPGHRRGPGRAATTDSQPSFPGRSRLLRGLSASSQGQWPSSGVDGTTRIPPSGTESPMTRSRLIIAATAVIVAIAVGGFVVYDQVLRGDSAAALALPTASTASSAPAASAAAGASGAPAASTGTSAASAGDVAGTWNVAANSVAGYRVREQLANLPAESDAVGRTDKVTGSITVETRRDDDDPDRRRRSAST